MLRGKLFKSKKVLVGMTLAISVGLLAGCGVPKTNESIDTSKDQLNEAIMQTNVVIIGSGGAGLAAAIEAHDAGKEVIVVEKMSMVGGNTLRATGGLNAAGTSVQAELGIEDNIETHLEDTMTGGYNKNIPELASAMVTGASDAVEWLIELGADLSDVGKLGGSTNNRSHRPSGGAPVGPHLVEVLKASVEERGIDILTKTTAIEILAEEGKVTGIVAKDENDAEFIIEADAVILATGGFGANSTMFTEYDAALKGFGTTNQPGATGDGITMAKEIGAGLVQIQEIQTHPTAVPSNGYMITEAVRGNGAILINKEGKRFVNEMLTRDVVSEAILAQEGQTSFLFFDETVRESLSAIDGYIKQGIVVEADTIEELAEKLGMDAEILVNTAKTYTESVNAKTDAEFGRTDLPRAIETGKFYVIEVAPAVHHTMGGIAINEEARVLTEDGQVIEGLFAAGEVVGGVHGGNRLGGNALADIIVFGRIAGQNASK